MGGLGFLDFFIVVLEIVVIFWYTVFIFKFIIGFRGLLEF